jgi:hypothetical protein
MLRTCEQPGCTGGELVVIGHPVVGIRLIDKAVGAVVAEALVDAAKGAPLLGCAPLDVAQEILNG